MSDDVGCMYGFLLWSNLPRPWSRTALVGGHTQGGIDPCGVTEEEYMELDAHKLMGKLGLIRLPPTLLS